MGISTMVLAPSGSGKSASIRNLNPETTLVIKVVNKPFPFKSTDWKKWDDKTKTGSWISTDNYELIQAILKGAKSRGKSVVVIDDAQYLMANEFMRRSEEKGFDKFTSIAKNFWSLVTTVNEGTDDDFRVYFLQHTEETATGTEKAKTIGKMLDEKVTLEGLFTIVLGAKRLNNEYKFITQTNGQNTLKSPMGLFEEEVIENDLSFVDEQIKKYYDIEEK